MRAGSRYSRLPDAGDSPDSSFAPPFPDAYEERQGVWERARTWWQQHARVPWQAAEEDPPPQPSGYLTLIPLSDARLQPRDARYTAAFLLAFAASVALAVFLAVPRGVTAGEVSVSADRMSWNTTKSTYQLRLRARIPVYNPNYRSATIEGRLQVYFYQTEAGWAEVGPVRLLPRAAPAMVDVAIDASDVPSDYILAILSQCSTFPEVLVFFLKGRLSAKLFLQRQHLAPIDTYFMLDCKNGGTVPSTEPPPPPPRRRLPPEPDDAGSSSSSREVSERGLPP